MSKKNLILGGILIALVAFAYIWSGPLKEWKTTKSQENNFLAAISSGEANKIEISKGGQTTVLEKTGETWRVNGAKNFYVSKEIAGAISTALSEAGLQPLEVASVSRDKKKSFATDDSGIAVKVYQGEKIFDFVIGNNDQASGGTYLSYAGTDKTYEIGMDLKSLFGREEWRDLAIFSFIKERATKVRFQYPDRQFTAENIENKWAGTAPKKFPVTEAKITAVLGVLENLTAAKIPAQTFKGTGLEKNGLIIQVVGADYDYTLMVGDCTKDDLCYAKRGDNDNLYLITKAQKDALNKKMADLK